MENIKKLAERRADITKWLKENAPAVFTEQKHLDSDSTERAYWHYGYMVALQDVINLFEGKTKTLH